MLSSLEALDADDTPPTIPVPRHGAFQPKAKARARKGGIGTAHVSSSQSVRKTENSAFAVSTADNHNERSQDDATRLQEEAQTAIRKEAEACSDVTAHEVLNKAGVEIRSTHNSEMRNSEIDLNFAVDAVYDCQRASALDEPIALAQVSGTDTDPIIEISERDDRSSHILSEQVAILSMRLGNDAVSPLLVCNAPSPDDEAHGLHSFGIVEPAIKHVIEVEEPSKQPSNGVIDLTHSSEQDSPGAPKNKKILKKDKQYCLQSVDAEGRVQRPKKSSVVGRGVRAACEAKSIKISKRKKHSYIDANEQQEMASVDTNLNAQKKTESTGADGAEKTAHQEALEKKGEHQLVEKGKRRRSMHADERRDDVKSRPSAIHEASSTKEKRVCLASSYDTSPSQTNFQVAVEASAAEESAQQVAGIAGIKQQANSHMDGNKGPCEIDTNLGTRKRNIRKPARYLDGADDEGISGVSSTKRAIKVPKKNGKEKNHFDTDRSEGFAENDLLSELFPNLPETIRKLREANVNGFRTTLEATSSQPSKEALDQPNGSSEPVAPAKEVKRKRFKKLIPGRKRVERRAINPADPDLDPKTMTMKDIIRLAETKERMLKKDNAERSKTSNHHVTMDEPERESETYDSTFMAPQVQIVDGQIVINEESLVRQAHPKDDIRTYRRVEETHAKLNYHSYLKRTRKRGWRPEETNLFFQALREFGTNFEMMKHLFPGRTRKHIVLKFKKEERRSRLRIAEAMRVKPCGTSHFVEVMSSLNLLTGEMEELETGPAELSAEQSLPTQQEILDDTWSLRGGNCQMAADVGSALKLDEPSVHSICREETGGSGLDNVEASSASQCNQNQELVTEHVTHLQDEAKHTESPNGASKLPGKKKSLFSYQNSAAMPS